MLTKNGICLKLSESDYKLLKYGLVFYFSSQFYLDKFKNNVENYIEQESLKLKNKYKINSNFEVYLALSYYKRIEQRGFFVFDDVEKREIKSDTIFLNVIIK